jgi:type VI secretion system secreted protein VgrG
MSVFKQEARLGKFHCALGQDALVLQRFTGSEAMQSIFEFSVDVLAEDPDVDLDRLIGTNATVEIATLGHGPRYFDGIVTDGAWLGPGENGHKFSLSLKAWPFVATLKQQQRIFHEMSVLDIIEAVLADYADLGSPALSDKTTGSYQPIEYVVQYGESDYAFVSRLMERFGINFHFKHELGSHTMVLTDDVNAHPEVPGGSREVNFVERFHQGDEEHFHAFRRRGAARPGKVRLTDYNFKEPDATMAATVEGQARHAFGKQEVFGYPGGYLDHGAGRKVADLRLAQARAGSARFDAMGATVALGPGMKLAIEGRDLPEDIAGKDFVCLSARYSFTSDSYGSGGAQGDDQPFQGTYTLAMTGERLVPRLRTPRARIYGPQTAKVVGSGEIDCDEHGRILVQFHWDLDGAQSMRCRVAQSWAGNGWGGMVIPRVGMEVVVQFIDGDPDAPLVTGCVYNGTNAPPYELAANKTMSVFKTQTHGGGGFNELSFEDEAGQERIFMHGQKDQEIEILNDRTKTVGNDQSETVGNDKTIQVGANHTEQIGADQTLTVSANRSLTVGQGVSQSVGTSHTTSAGVSIETTTMQHKLMASGMVTIQGPGGTITIDPTGVTISAPLIRLAGKVMMGG